MLLEVQKSKVGYVISSTGLVVQTPSSIGLLEKDIEGWLAENPNLLLPNEQLLVIGRSLAGEAMADVLALDALGRLVIVEIKRDWSDRTTVGQLLEYAARMQAASFDELQNYARRLHKDVAFDLYQEFLKFSEGSKAVREAIGREQRVFIVAPESDAVLKSIVNWLKSFTVPIEFVPFSVYADHNGVPRFLQMEGVVTSPEPSAEGDSWAGHWIFNTNQTHAPGAYEKMFETGVAAIYGYSNGPANLEGSARGDKVLAYVNQQGIRAMGTVLDPQVSAGTGIFLDDEGNQLPDEYHLSVSWEVVPEARAITASEAASGFGYSLPVRSVFAKLHRGRAATRLEQELRTRANSK